MNKINTAAGALSRPQRAQGSRLNLVPLDERHGIGGKVIGVANAGPRIRVGISLVDCRYHIHCLGPTGTGKTTLLMRMILDDVEAGRGVAAFDPAKGDLIRDLLARLPKSCGDRLVLIDPDERAAPPAINLLDPAVHGGTAHDGTPHDVAANLTAVMAKVWARWWGHRTADICYHGLLTLAHLPGATLAQLPRLLSDPEWRTSRVNAVTGSLGVWEANTLGEFWDGFNELPTAARSTLVAPLLSRLRLVLAHPLATSLFGVAATTFSFADVLDGGVLLARLPKGVIGEDGTRLVGSLLLAGLWQATTARARIPEHDRADAMIVLDECHNFLHLPIGIDDALAEARGLHTSFVLAHQYLGQLSGDMAEAIDANARNKVYFALAPRDAIDQARHLRPYLDDGDLIRLGGYEVVLRPVAGGRVVPPVTADTEPPPPPIAGRSARLRSAAREHTGIAIKQRRRLLGETATAAAPNDAAPNDAAPNDAAPNDAAPNDAALSEQPAVERAPAAPPVGRNTFPASSAASSSQGAERSNETSNEQPNESSNEPDGSAEHTPLNTPSAHVDDGGEDR